MIYVKTFDMWMCEDNNHAAMKTIWRIKQKTEETGRTEKSES